MARVSTAAPALRVGLICLTMVACNSDDAGESSPSGTSEATTGSSSTFAPSDASDVDTGTSEGSSGGDGMDAQCSVWDQDCPASDKCVPWSDQPDLVPDDIRCCPVVGSPAQIGDDCTVEGYFGSCIDDCATGSFCLDIDDDGAGVCLAFCRGDAANPVCGPNESCLIYFAGLPLCFRKCDPLLQNCGESEGCYPDEATAGGTGFICLPQVGLATLGETCWLLSNCEPGLICVTPDFLPDCGGVVGCCSPICDLSAPDDCNALMPGTECISWYYGGQAPPSADLQNVGACALPN